MMPSLAFADVFSAGYATRLHQPFVEEISSILDRISSSNRIGRAGEALSLHVHLCRNGLETQCFFGNRLVSLLAEAGRVCYARQLFEKLPCKVECSWSALITAYVSVGDPQGAISLYERMPESDSSRLKWYAFVALLKACAVSEDLEQGRCLHSQISTIGILETDVCIRSALVSMYARCGCFLQARETFGDVSTSDVVLWTSLISGYVDFGHHKEALLCMKQMQSHGISPNHFTLVCLLKACGDLEDPDEGREMHSRVISMGYETDPVIGSALIDMHAKCGCLLAAQETLDKMSLRSVPSWTALISGYVESGDCSQALECFQQMQNTGASPDASTYVCGLKSCSGLGSVVDGRRLHTDIVVKGFESNPMIVVTLMDMYAKCESLDEAENIFNTHGDHDVVAWTALTAAYVGQGCGVKALQCVKSMENEEFPLNMVTLSCTIQACASVSDFGRGQEIHALIVKKGLEKEIITISALITMYCKCGLLADAEDLLRTFPMQVVLWTTLLSGYVEHGYAERALNCFQRMQQEGTCVNVVTYVCGFKTCANLIATVKGQELHVELVKRGLEREITVGNVLVYMYAKFAFLDTARKLLENLPVQDVISWNALIAGYIEHGQVEEALDCYGQMKRQGCQLDTITYHCCSKACGSTGSITTGFEMHTDVVKRGLETEVMIGNTLIDMYVKCGWELEAQEAFLALVRKDDASWNACIALYAQLGECENAFSTSERMVGEGILPNVITLISLLNACNHAGKLRQGLMLFERIVHVHYNMLTLEHYSCLINLLGRAGLIEKATDLIKKMPLHPDIVIWHSLLEACRKWGEVNLGRFAFQEAIGFHGANPAAYISMYQIYVNANMQEDANSLQVMRQSRFILESSGSYT